MTSQRARVAVRLREAALRGAFAPGGRITDLTAEKERNS
jgi:hypothetical protein